LDYKSKNGNATKKDFEVYFVALSKDEKCVWKAKEMTAKAAKVV
jgi:hypothetical protein